MHCIFFLFKIYFYYQTWWIYIVWCKWIHNNFLPITYCFIFMIFPNVFLKVNIITFKYFWESVVWLWRVKRTHLPFILHSTAFKALFLILLFCPEKNITCHKVTNFRKLLWPFYLCLSQRSHHARVSILPVESHLHSKLVTWLPFLILIFLCVLLHLHPQSHRAHGGH